MKDQFATQKDVGENLSFLEKLVSHFSGDDEYKAAMLNNQRVQTQILADQLGMGMNQPHDPTNVDVSNLPIGMVGATESKIANGDDGRAIFDISGSKYEATVTAQADLEKNEAVVVNGDGNQVKPSSNVQDAFSMMVGGGAGGRDTVIRPDRFEVFDTSDLDGANELGSIVMEPGEKKVLAGIEGMEQGAYIMSAGATDADDVRFALVVDGEYNVGGVTNSPLGSMNEPFSFVTRYGGVVPVTESAQYIAIYDEDGSGQVELTGRIDAEVF